MPRTIWKGILTFGLVEIPIGLVPAENTKEFHFTLLDRRDLSPIGYERKNKRTGKTVAYRDIVKGYEYEKDEFVVLSEADFRWANPEATQTVEILDFVDRDQISPLYFDKPYYLQQMNAKSRGYELLRRALVRTGKVGIARVVVRTREYIAAVMPEGKQLVLELLRYSEELRPPPAEAKANAKEARREARSRRPSKIEVSAREVAMAERLIKDMSTDWKPEKYHDTYWDDIHKLVEKKVAAGETQEIVTEEPAPRKARDVVDIMPLLRESLRKKTHGDRPRRKTPARSGRPRRRAA